MVFNGFQRGKTLRGNSEDLAFVNKFALSTLRVW